MSDIRIHQCAEDIDLLNKYRELNGQFGSRPDRKPGAGVLTGVEQKQTDDYSGFMQVGEVRDMPMTTWQSIWYEDSIERAEAVVAEHEITGVVTRVPLPVGYHKVANRYVAELRTKDGGVAQFIFDTSDMEDRTPPVAEVIADATDAALRQRGAVSETGSTALDGLIELLGERAARDVIAQRYEDAPYDYKHVPGGEGDFKKFWITTEGGQFPAWGEDADDAVLKFMLTHPYEEMVSFRRADD